MGHDPHSKVLTSILYRISFGLSEQIIICF